ASSVRACGCAAAARAGAWSTRRGSTRRPDVLMDEPADRGHHGLLLGGGQLAVNRNREAFIRRALGVRKFAAAIAEVREARLQVKGHRVVDLVADALLVEVPLERVASWGADHELIE